MSGLPLSVGILSHQALLGGCVNGQAGCFETSHDDKSTTYEPGGVVHDKSHLHQHNTPLTPAWALLAKRLITQACWVRWVRYSLVFAGFPLLQHTMPSLGFSHILFWVLMDAELGYETQQSGPQRLLLVWE